MVILEGELATFIMDGSLQLLGIPFNIVGLFHNSLLKNGVLQPHMAPNCQVSQDSGLDLPKKNVFDG